MVTAMNTATAANVNGISVPVIDPTAFIKPTNSALDAGIPVLAYNANPPASTASQNHQQCYIGQDLFQAGVEAGNRILPFVSKGDLVAGLIATPGSLNIQPRIDGASSVLKPAGIDFVEQATGALLSQESTAVEAYYLGHKDVKFMYAVDDGTGEAVATTITKEQSGGQGPRVWLGHRRARTEGRTVGGTRLLDRPAGVPAGLPPGHVPVPVHDYRRADAPV